MDMCVEIVCCGMPRVRRAEVAFSVMSVESWVVLEKTLKRVGNVDNSLLLGTPPAHSKPICNAGMIIACLRILLLVWGCEKICDNDLHRGFGLGTSTMTRARMPSPIRPSPAPAFLVARPPRARGCLSLCKVVAPFTSFLT